MSTDVTTTGVADLADECVALLLDASPVWATLFGVPGYDDRLEDPSAAGQAALRDRALDLAARAEARTGDLDAIDEVTRVVVVEQCRALAEEVDARVLEFAVADSIFAPATAMLGSLAVVSTDTPQRAQSYLTRLAALPGYLDALAQRHRDGVGNGRVPARHLIDACVAQIDRFLDSPGDDPLRRPPGPELGFDDFDARRDAILADAVYPAYARYRTILVDEIAAHGRPADRPGLCHLPDGAEVYATLTRQHTTTDRTADDLHETGLALMADLDREYVELGRRVFGLDTPAAVFARLREDPALRWNTAGEMLDAARAVITRAEKEAPRWFGVVAPEHCEVVAVPSGEAPGAPAAYYMPPSLDGVRPGTYYTNTHRVTERFRYILEATAVHEAVPGHHFQLSIAQGLDALPMLRRMVVVNAYAEGWGLYTERLADEMGLYSDDIARFGMLTCDSMRAGRLVVDTGLHAKGWTRQQAIDFLIERTPMAEVEIVAEVDRYIAVPGQALSYMVGRLEIQRLRAVAQERLGDRFDIRAFHDLVLGGGSLSMTALAAEVDRWIATHP